MLLSDRRRAACADPEVDPGLFIPLSTGRMPEFRVVAAKGVCARCPVRSPCLADAVAEPVDDITIRGGLTASERRSATAFLSA